MARFHINAKGNPYPCKAKVRCPFGDLTEDHYDSKEDAMKAYEASQKEAEVPEAARRDWSSYSLEDLQGLEVKTLEEKFKSQEAYSDDEYQRHREYIRKVDAHYPSTHKENTKKVKGKTVYSDERLAKHDEVVEALKERYAQVPTEGKVIFSGGLPGAGKTTFLKKLQGDNLKDYAIINPDDVKEEMVKRGMAPIIPGLAPLETNSIIHYEASVITDRLYAELRSERKNLVVDKTMGSENVILKEIDELKAEGYERVDAVFVDVDPDVAYDRIVNRHRAGLDAYVKSGGTTLGERAVKGTIVSGSRTDDENFYSKNSVVFDKLSKSGHFTSTQYFDNNSTRDDLQSA